MTSFVTFILYSAAITATILIVTYFAGTTKGRTPKSDGSNKPLPARRIHEST
ncbi:hypothetical protein [Allorhodopirellula heiligendammensis]|uniref:Uncharacterized protein n=1 Tax=Allorhodopirellula heiligendammensis TaxID=2714739 RepID=A0A5C6C0U2_9BACT|nr:hypothetical protein [Allorhodopirellula heiligendammensis]TWU16469.1 hypothetical protein Poly21_36740 [Allorhodopirellula heiligendammensis]